MANSCTSSMIMLRTAHIHSERSAIFATTLCQTVKLLYTLILWRPLLPYGYSYKASCVRPSYAVICNFWHPGTLTLRAVCQSARMSKITNDGLTRSGTGCFSLQLHPYGNSGRQRVKRLIESVPDCKAKGCRLQTVNFLRQRLTSPRHSVHIQTCLFIQGGSGASQVDACIGRCLDTSWIHRQQIQDLMAPVTCNSGSFCRRITYRLSRWRRRMSVHCNDSVPFSRHGYGSLFSVHWVYLPWLSHVYSYRDPEWNRR